MLLMLNHTVPCNAGERVNHETIKAAIMREAVSQGVSPKLAIGVATVESGLNPSARGSKGEIGLFQLLPSNIRAGSGKSTSDLIREGIKELKYWQTHCPSTEDYTFVNCYNQGLRHPKYPKLFPYYRKVMQAMR